MVSVATFSDVRLPAPACCRTIQVLRSASRCCAVGCQRRSSVPRGVVGAGLRRLPQWESLVQHAQVWHTLARLLQLDCNQLIAPKTTRVG